ncbi:phosphate:Na+ symporter [Hydrogenispora ethanolica]|uniref:Phosphate:Na+ symporter n=1 Tax=Hydrogenispora ethanolica TaxID=1082276 RepID=A0A4R1R7G1_HYDET|nr:Na/Pi symporter [Hydrogenispora ethanolica]TCL61544.1 phosphate:Na+ symporter [Hydrogenispora ethanolica]
MPASIEGLLILCGGLAIFLNAVSRFGDGIQKLAGERIRSILEKQSREPHASIFTGIGMAAALQSNVLTFGVISSMVNAGLLGLLPALWIMLGVNLGMTVNAHLMALNLGAWAFLILFFGFILNFYIKKRNLHYIGQVLFNLGMMYLGFIALHQAFVLLATESTTLAMLTGIFHQPWLGFLLGLCVSILLRNCNAMVVFAQAAVGINLGLTDAAFLSGAIAIIIGANVGTTIINMLVGLDRVPTAKKANWMHFSFNLTTGVAWLLALPLMLLLVDTMSREIGVWIHQFELAVFQWSTPLGNSTSQWFNVWQLALANSFFNISIILIWFPVTLLASKFGFSLFAEQVKTTANGGKTFLDRRALQSPALALILASHEINQMAATTIEMLKAVRLAFFKGQVHLLDGVYRNEALVDDLQEQITFYLSALLSQNSLTEVQSHRLAGLLHAVSDIERVGDHANNIAHLAEKKYQEQLPFSELALNEIELFFGKAIDFYTKTTQALRENNLELAKQIEHREESINKLEEELRQNHIHRLNQGKCWPGSGVVYVEILSNLERVAAHSANVVSVVLEEGEQ